MGEGGEIQETTFCPIDIFPVRELPPPPQTQYHGVITAITCNQGNKTIPPGIGNNPLVQAAAGRQIIGWLVLVDEPQGPGASGDVCGGFTKDRILVFKMKKRSSSWMRSLVGQLRRSAQLKHGQ